MFDYFRPAVAIAFVALVTAFAIPVVQAQDFLLLRAPGSAIGVMARTTVEGDLVATGSTDGVVLTAVREGSPAARAGLRPGDVVVSFDRLPVRSRAGFLALIRDTRPSHATPIAFVRAGVRREVSIAPVAGVQGSDDL